MYGDEFSKIKMAVSHYEEASNAKAEIQKKRQRLADKRKQHALITVAFDGDATRMDLPTGITGPLYDWLDRQMAIQQDELARFQAALTCPAGTCDR